MENNSLYGHEAIIAALCHGLGMDRDIFMGPMDVAFYRTLPERWENTLRDQGVCLDDYDYAIVTNGAVLDKREDEYVGPNLLFGCCENTWRLVHLEGKETAIGMAYHA